MASETITILATESHVSGKTLFLADALCSFDQIVCPTELLPTAIARYKLGSDTKMSHDIVHMLRSDTKVILVDENTRDLTKEQTEVISYDGALLFFSCSYFVETQSYSLLRRALSFGYSSYYKQLVSDINERVDYLVHCYDVLATEDRIVKLVLIDDDDDNSSPLHWSVMEQVKDKIRCRVNIPSEWILFCDKMATKEETALFREFLKDLIIRTGATRNRARFVPQ